MSNQLQHLKRMGRVSTDTRKPQSLQERLRNSLLGSEKFQAAMDIPTFADKEVCLLLDCSGSMDIMIDPAQRAIDALRAMAEDFKDVRRFEFSDGCVEIPVGIQLAPYGANGGTNMRHAFETVKAAGIKHVIIMTDGQPADPEGTLKSAQGLRVDVFYIGPDPAPEFLKQLAQMSGGSYGKDSLTARKALTQKVRALIAAPSKAIEL